MGQSFKHGFYFQLPAWTSLSDTHAEEWGNQTNSVFIAGWLWGARQDHYTIWGVNKSLNIYIKLL